MRGPALAMQRVPLFVWGVLITNLLLLLAQAYVCSGMHLVCESILFTLIQALRGSLCAVSRVLGWQRSCALCDESVLRCE